MMMAGVPEIDVQELAQKLSGDDNFVLLDVREAWELDYALINDSRLKIAPMSRLAQLGIEALPDEMKDKDAEVLVMCHHGVRSARATEWLLSQGWKNVFSVRGGIADYSQKIDASIGRY
jgi:rhodanese-related sulfurtransferase